MASAARAASVDMHASRPCRSPCSIRQRVHVQTSATPCAQGRQQESCCNRNPENTRQLPSVGRLRRSAAQGKTIRRLGRHGEKACQDGWKREVFRCRSASQILHGSTICMPQHSAARIHPSALSPALGGCPRVLRAQALERQLLAAATQHRQTRAAEANAWEAVEVNSIMPQASMSISCGGSIACPSSAIGARSCGRVQCGGVQLQAPALHSGRPPGERAEGGRTWRDRGQCQLRWRRRQEATDRAAVALACAVTRWPRSSCLRAEGKPRLGGDCRPALVCGVGEGNTR